MADIIRCRDCKYLKMWRTSEQAEQFGQIYECEIEVLLCPSPDDYCSKAERKEEQKEEQKIGHWITTRTFMHDGEFYCDKCKCDSPNNEKWDYCPNCGAKMIEPQERSDKE